MTMSSVREPGLTGAVREPERITVTVSQGVPGPVGPVGPIGPAGPAGPQGEQGPPGASNAAYTATWRWSTTTTPPPSAGQIRINGFPASMGTMLYVSDVTEGGTDVSAFLSALEIGTDIRIQEKADATNWVRYDITALPIDNGTYFSIGIAFIDGGPAGGINNNVELDVSFLLEGMAAAAWYTGTGAPAVDLGKSGDMYLENDGDVWQSQLATGWTQSATNIRGPAGEAGAPGPAGTVSAAGDGTAAAPGIAFASDPNTGIFHPVGADLLGVSTAGVLRWQWNASGHLIAGTDNQVDIGASGANRPRSIYVGTSVVTPVLYGPSNVVEMRNGTTTQNFNIYYSYVDATNYSRLAFTTAEGNNFYIRTERGTSGIAWSLWLGSPASLRFATGEPQVLRWTIPAAGHLWAQADNTYDIGQAALNRPRNIYQAGGAFQSYNPGAGIANDGTNYERLSFSWSGAYAFLTTQRGGTGLIRGLKVGTEGQHHLYLMTNSTDRWYIDGITSVGSLIPIAHSTYDIGLATGNKPRNVYVAGAVVNRTKAGAPVDADFNTPTDGMLALDTTGHALYMRSGGTWRSVALT